MIAQFKNQTKSLYDTDYNLWVLKTVKQLENRDLESLDWDNLIEEVLDLSKRDKRKLQSLLKRIFEHLLKLTYWESEIKRNKNHWQTEILNFRQQIREQLKDSPSLKSYLREIYEQCYQDGRKLASSASSLPLNTFPEEAIAPLEQVLDENWYPEQ